MTLADLARRVDATSRLSGRFVLRSGRVAEEYFDKYQFEADPVLLDALAERMVALVPSGTEVLAGLEMGGIAVVTALGRHTGLRARSSARRRSRTAPPAWRRGRTSPADGCSSSRTW